MLGDESGAYLAYVSISASDALVQKELIRTILKKEGRRVQTENNRKMCKHIKDKIEITFCPTTPFAPKRGKKSAKKGRRDSTLQDFLYLCASYDKRGEQTCCI